MGQLIGANFNLANSDQLIWIKPTRYIITEIVVENASTSLSNAAGGIYTAASQGGTALVAATQSYATLTGPTLWMALTLAGVVGTTVQTNNPWLYFNLSTAQGSAVTANIRIYGYDLSQ